LFSPVSSIQHTNSGPARGAGIGDGGPEQGVDGRYPFHLPLLKMFSKKIGTGADTKSEQDQLR